MIFGGLNLEQNARNTAHADTASNCDISGESLSGVADHTQLNSSALGTAANRTVTGTFMAKTMLNVAGGKFYDNFVEIADDLSLDTLVHWGQRGDNIYLADSGTPRVYSGGELRRMGLVIPTTAPTSTGQSDGQISGEGYQWAYSYYAANTDRESALSPYSDAINLNEGFANLSDFVLSTDSTVTHIKIYRIGGVVSEATFIAEIVNSGTPTYTDNTTDIDLDVGPAQEDNYPPPDLEGLLWDGTYMFGWIGPILYWSKAGQPEIFPIENFEIIGASDDPIKNIVDYFNYRVIFTKKKVYLHGGSDASFTLETIAGTPGTHAPLSAIAGSFGDSIINYLTVRGIRQSTNDGSSPFMRNELASLFTDDKGYGFYATTGENGFWATTSENGFWTDLGTGWEVGEYYDGRYVLAIDGGISPACLVVDDNIKPDNKPQIYKVDVPARISSMHESGGKLFFGDIDGDVYEWQEAATNKLFDWKSVQQDVRNKRKEIFKLWVDSENDITLTLHLDGAAQAPDTLSMSGSNRVEQDILLEVYATRVNVQFTATNAAAILHDFKFDVLDEIGGIN